MNKKDIASMITYENIKRIMESKNYITTDRIVWDTVKTLKKILNGPQIGQDIYSTCLEGPPGSGKTFYVKTYKKVLEELTGEPVKMIKYSCDSTTGKTDLYEDIRVSSAIVGNPEDVIIAGKLIEAIDSVNQGQKVILFLDEFEKSRSETDNFLNEFLQDGTVTTSQQGTITVAPEYRQNLQVFLAKNYERDLADQLLRRNHRIELEIMSPENFKKTVEMNLPNTDEDIRNVVILLYQKMYEKKDEFAKFPSCSEGMLGIQDACTLLEANAPADIIYADILSNMLKHPDDIDTFRVLFEKDAQLKRFCNQILGSENKDDNEARKQIYRIFFPQKIQEIAAELESERDRFKNAYERSTQTVNRLMEQVKQLKEDKAEEETKNSETKSTGTKIQVEENSIGEIKDADIIELDIDDIDSLSIIPVPKEFVENEDSVFFGSDKWYEIGRIEVEEKTDWEVVEFGQEEFLSFGWSIMLKLCKKFEDKPEFSEELKEYKKRFKVNDDWSDYTRKDTEECNFSRTMKAFFSTRLDDIRKYIRTTTDKSMFRKDGIVFEEVWLKNNKIYKRPEKYDQRYFYKAIGIKVIENGKEYYVFYANTPLLLEDTLYFYHYNDVIKDDNMFDCRHTTVRALALKIKKGNQCYIGEHFKFYVHLETLHEENISLDLCHLIDEYGRLIEGLECDNQNPSYIKNTQIDFRVKKCEGKIEEIRDLYYKIHEHTCAPKEHEVNARFSDIHEYLRTILLGEEYKRPEAISVCILKRDYQKLCESDETPAWIKNILNSQDITQDSSKEDVYKKLDKLLEKQNNERKNRLTTYNPWENRKKNGDKDEVVVEDEGR